MSRSSFSNPRNNVLLCFIATCVLVLFVLIGEVAKGDETNPERFGPTSGRSGVKLGREDAIRSFNGVLVDLSPLFAGASPTNFPSSDLRSKLVYFNAYINEHSPTNGMGLRTGLGGTNGYVWVDTWLRNYPHYFDTCSGIGVWAMPTGKVEVHERFGNKVFIYDYGTLPTPEEINAFREMAKKEDPSKGLLKH